MKVLVKCLLISILCLGIYTPVYAQQAEKLFQQGMMKEEAEGNLTEAIKIYNKLVDDTSVAREMRANALLHIGICYEKSGKKNASRVYEKLIEEFSDQTEISSLAKKKLKSIMGSDVKVQNKGLLTLHIKNDRVFGAQNIDNSGRYYLFKDWSPGSKELMYFDLVTGKTDSITEGNSWKAKKWSDPDAPVWSPDSKRVAYMWKAEGQKEVRITNLDRSNTQTIIKGVDEFDVPTAVAFSNDGDYLLGTINVNVGEEKHQKLVIISLANKKFKELINFGNQHAKEFKYSPDGKHITFSRRKENSSNQNIYSISLEDLSIIPIIEQRGDNYNPLWNSDGSSILFLSNNLGTIDLYKIAIKNGNPAGNPISIKRNMGMQVHLMGVAQDKSIYYNTGNNRRDIFTIDFGEKFETKDVLIEQITDLTLKYGGRYPRYSKDGKYICYQSSQSNFNVKKGEEIHKDLGRKYYVNIYDTKSHEHKELKLDMYVNYVGYGTNWHLLSWSYDDYKLLIHARIKENYEGGIFAVDVLDGKITPVLTNPNDKFGSKTVKKIGHSMHFSRDKNKIYYSAPDWKTYFEYNMLTKEKKEIIRNDDGFWFGEFLDKEENTCVIYNRFGTFTYNIKAKKMEKIAEKEEGPFIGTSPAKNYFYLWNGDENTIIRKSFKGDEKEKTISIKELFPGRELNFAAGGPEFHPLENKVAIELGTNSGTDIYKLTGVFE